MLLSTYLVAIMIIHTVLRYCYTPKTKNTPTPLMVNATMHLQLPFFNCVTQTVLMDYAKKIQVAT